MHIGLGLWQEQTQKLVMTPELRQAITVLQFSSYELLEYIENEMTQNPVIEWSAADWAKVAQELRAGAGWERASSRDVKEVPFEAVVRRTVTLQEHLSSQLALLPLTPREKRLAEYIIGNLNANGYLTVDTEEMAAVLKATRTEVEQALRHVQSLEPAGVGARDLRECLLLQLRERGEDTPVMQKLVQDHLQDVADAKYSKIAESLGISLWEAQAASDLLKTLDPKPGRAYSDDPPAYIVPDLTVEKVGSDYVVLVNDRVTPRLSINDFYRGILSGGKQEIGSETRDYITGKLNAALWLLRSIEQRRQTIYKVTQAIVEMQRDFFDYGVDRLKPLTLRQVAEKVNLHESTVSRATTGKYAQTPRGVFELKYFFTSGVSTDFGEGASAESIKAKIRKWIAQENPKAPLSDQKITDLLHQEGIQISRRTVAKYREEIGIPSSARRKRV
jgi:RNA polymerase sigma-54 factor